MALNSINTNISAYFAQANITHANNMTSGSIGRLSSGNRIVRASDDVAAMSVGTSLRTQVSTLKMALTNASQGSSMLQVADGALGKIQDMLLRQKALATQATSGSLTGTERGFLNQEFQNLTQEIDRLVQNTNFNGVNLLGGGLGTKGVIASTDAIAAAFDPTGAANTSFSAVSQVAIEAFDRTTGGTLTTVGGVAAAGEFLMVDAADVVLADAAYQSVNGAVYGQISKFAISNANYSATATEGSATLTITLNGVEFSGSINDADTDVTVSNGTTHISLGVTAFSLLNEAAANTSVSQLYTDFADTVIMHTQTVGGVNFSGTALDGIVGQAGTGAVMIRTSDPTRLDIGNFAYVGNGGADEHILTVQINGETWTATGVDDVIAAGEIIVFEKGNGEAMLIDTTGLTEALGVDPTADMLNTPSLRDALVNALNIGFSKAGSGVDFALGTQKSDSLHVQIRSSSTASLYGGQALNVSTVADAQTAGEALNVAISTVTSIRADVGAMMSRFDFASANIEISLQNQDAARGVLLDTDVAAESTAYATNQVQLQAGIAVLAQANLLPQNLLKLIG